MNGENQSKTVVEINGVKMEVDLRYAKRIEHLTVGTRVKVLVKQYDGHKVRHGVIIGFEPFEKLPTIIVSVAVVDYSGAKLEFIYYNAETKDTEIVVAHDDDEAALDKSEVCDLIDREISKKELEIKDLRDRKNYFLQKFACYWQPVEQTA